MPEPETLKENPSNLPHSCALQGDEGRRCEWFADTRPKQNKQNSEQTIGII